MVASSSGEAQVVELIVLIERLGGNVDREATPDCFSDRSEVGLRQQVVGIGPRVSEMPDRVSKLEQHPSDDGAVDMPEVTTDVVAERLPSGQLS